VNFFAVHLQPAHVLPGMVSTIKPPDRYVERVNLVHVADLPSGPAAMPAEPFVLVAVLAQGNAGIGA